MAQPLIRIDTDERIYNTEAFFLASPRIWTPSQTLIPVDGANAWKRKVGNNIDTYTNLSFEGAGAGGSTAWGDITGTLSDQTDLQNVTEGLANAIGAIVTQTITNGETTTSPSEDAVFDALAGKADAVFVNTTKVSGAVTCIITGTTDGAGKLGSVDFAVASGDRPAFSTVYLIGGACDSVPSLCVIESSTLSTYRVQFFTDDIAGTPLDSTAAYYTIIGIPA